MSNNTEDISFDFQAWYTCTVIKNIQTVMFRTSENGPLKSQFPKSQYEVTVVFPFIDCGESTFQSPYEPNP